MAGNLRDTACKFEMWRLSSATLCVTRDSRTVIMELGRFMMDNEKYRAQKMDFKVLLGYFVTYIIIISLLFFAIGGYSYVNIISERRNTAKEEIDSYIGRKMDVLDEKLSDTVRVAMSFYQDKEVARIRTLSHEFQPSEYYRFDTLSKSLEPYTSGGFIEQIGLYFHGNEILIASNLIDRRTWVYYNLIFDICGYNYEAFRENALGREPGSFYLLEETENSRIMLAYTLPYSDDGQGATVFTRLDVSGILSVQDIQSRYEGAVLQLTDHEGRILYQEDKAASFMQVEPAAVQGDNNYEYYERRSEMLGCSLRIYVDKRELYADSIAVQTNITVIFLSFLFISLVLAVIFARRISKPVTELMRICDDNGKGTNQQAVWEFISGTELKQIVKKVSSISQSNSLLSKQVQSYRDGIKALFFKKLLNGEMISEEEIVMIRDDIQSLFGFGCYTVAILKLVCLDKKVGEEPWPLGSAFISVFSYLEQNKEKEAHFCMTGIDQAAIILCESIQDSRQGIEAYLNGISDFLLKTGHKACWAVGRTVNNLDQIFMSHQNAAQVLSDLDIVGSEKYVVFADGEKRDAQVNYTVEDEQRILHALSQGETAAVRRLIRELFSRNEKALKKSKTCTETFVSALSGTVIRALDHMTEMEEKHKEEIDLYLWQMKNAEDVIVLERYMGVITGLFADILSSQSESRHRRLLERMKQFIHENFSDSELCLGMLAEKLSLTESYVSAFFKQNSGKNITHYIEKVRMQKAKELLLDEGMSTAEISVAVGYNNPNTFYKAFKRHFGINPKAYRERLQMIKENGGPFSS